MPVLALPVLALASVVTWQGAPSLLAAAATTLSTIGRMQTNDVILRVLLLAATPFWAVHDLLVGCFPGLTADVLSMATGTTMVLRHSRCAHRSDPRPIDHKLGAVEFSRLQMGTAHVLSRKRVLSNAINISATQQRFDDIVAVLSTITIRRLQRFTGDRHQGKN